MVCGLLWLLLTVGLSVASETGTAGDSAAKETELPAIISGRLYVPSANPMADLAARMVVAKENNNRLLIVLGANWCHDSRALASRLFTAPLDTLVNDNYETLFVDVGYLETGRDVITSLGIPVYYATPTVLIVDPVSGEVVNANDRHQWANAAGISMAASIDYFRQYEDAAVAVSEGENNAYLQTLLDDIDAFEQLQADRLYQAYAVLGPMLKAYEEGDTETFPDDLWDEVRDYRYQVPADLDALRAEAREQVASGETGIELNYPVYPAFSWELN